MATVGRQRRDANFVARCETPSCELHGALALARYAKTWGELSA